MAEPFAEPEFTARDRRRRRRVVIVRVTDYQGVYQEYELPLDDTFTLHLPWDFSMDVGGEHFEAHKEALVELEWADE